MVNPITAWWGAVLCQINIHRWDSWVVITLPNEEDIESGRVSPPYQETGYLERECQRCPRVERL